MTQAIHVSSISPTQLSLGSNKSSGSVAPLVVSSSHMLPLLPGAIPPESTLYFYGKITREQAEDLLIGHGSTEGLFLLRESVNRNYVISICHLNRVHHYNVERQSDGSYRIQTGHRFLGPVELVQHHSRQTDGFLTLTRLPLNRADGTTPLILQGLHVDELEQKLRLKAAEMGLKGQSVEEALSGPMRDHLRYLVLKELHTCQPWYHHTIGRREAERRIIEDGNLEGSFLVRYRKEDGTFVLSLCNEAEPKHYKIEEHLDRLSIEGGQYFETLIEMIDHYHHRQDGLLCKLRRPVVAPSFTRSRSGSNAVQKGHEQKPVVHVEDSAVQTIVSGAIAGWNGSQSLPSLCSVPFASAENQDTNLNTAKEETNVRTKQDLISFADWPHVTRLLLNNQANINGAVSRTTTTSMTTDTNPFPLTLFTPTTPIQDSLVDITPTSVKCTTTQPVFSKNLSFDSTKQNGNVNTANQNVHNGRHGFNSGDQELGRAYPSGYPLRNEPQQQQKQQRSQHTRAVSLPSAPNCLQPIRICDPPIGRATAEVNAAIVSALSNAKTSNSGSSIPHSLPGSHAKQDATFGSDRSLSETSTTHSTSLSSDFPPQTLHFPPILDTPWEEPDFSEELAPSRSGSGSGGSGFVPFAPEPAPTSITQGTNPFLNVFSPILGRPNSMVFCPSSYPTNSQPPTLSHSPDVTTFCSAACCCQANNVRSSVSGADSSINGRSAWANSMCQDKAQFIYDELPPSNFLLSPENVTLKERLGGGNFGHVVKGIYRTPTGQEVPVAVKTLKPTQIANAGEREILAEARTMAQLKHRHVVRLIGVCKEDQFMLVLELVPLGPINKYLKKRPDVPVHTLTELMHQVALGMAYLESCKFVHRDLAARNVLLVTRHFAKISDFGMSKALNFGSDYYRAATAGKWPLKWYAPECIYYFRFDSKSDVWSYGITLWEVYSYGERPYRDMKGAQILAMLDQGLRLSKPSRCPESIYGVMQQCWNFEGVRRPTFAELVLTTSRILKMMPAPVCGAANELQSKSSEIGRFSPTRRQENGASGSGGSGVNSCASDAASF
ncbi:hypothetical protein EG68_01325 [Paragonimus skrjabini miyazakii]|uniref:Tyrosine-protein kinase n=1 Tax=Paragonimus skrjabini miyazakii TaxID=59628 RepID=A0A8S9ZC51_9TREM|nr:hypothetical protein EG68_01325 [Paragonimus skrjabini miyazakii]